MYRYFLIWMIAVSACGHLIVVPENTAVIDGTTVVLRCQTNYTTQSITWKDSTNPKDEVKIFTRNRIAEHLLDVYKVNNSVPGLGDLHIKASLSTAKRYQCHEGSFGPSADAELIVFASDPECNSIRKSEKDVENQSLYVELSCRVKFAGLWRPSFTWMSQKSNVPIKEGVTQTTNGNVITSMLSVPVYSEDNTTRYIFKLNFDQSLKPAETSANNIPLYSFNWTSPMIGDMQFEDADPNSKSCDVTCTVVIVMSVVAFLLIVVFVVLLVVKCRKNVSKQRGTSNRGPSPRVIRERETGEIYHTVDSEHERYIQNESGMIGDDGTTYVCLQGNGPSPIPAHHRPPPPKENFDTSVYAHIDHTDPQYSN